MTLLTNTIESPQFRVLLDNYARAACLGEGPALSELAQVVAYADAWQASLLPPLSVRQAADLVKPWHARIPVDRPNAVASPGKVMLEEIAELRALLAPPRGEECLENVITLQEWFGLSYAQFLTLPRVVMEAMPQDWQAAMTDLLLEMDAAFDWLPANNGTYMVRVAQVDEDGQAGKMRDPDADLCNYRHPNIEHRRLLPMPLEEKP